LQQLPATVWRLTVASSLMMAGTSLRVILRSPVVILAISAAALGHGINSLLMMATPISMHAHAGHSLESTKFVIQSHRHQPAAPRWPAGRAR